MFFPVYYRDERLALKVVGLKKVTKRSRVLDVLGAIEDTAASANAGLVLAVKLDLFAQRGHITVCVVISHIG